MATKSRRPRRKDNGPKSSHEHNEKLWLYVEDRILQKGDKGWIINSDYTHYRRVRARKAVLYAARKFQRFVVEQIKQILSHVAPDEGGKTHSDNQRYKAMVKVVKSLGLREVEHVSHDFPFYKGKTYTTKQSRALAGLYFARNYIDHLALRENMYARIYTVTYSGTRAAGKHLLNQVTSHGYNWPVSGGRLRSASASRSMSTRRRKSTRRSKSSTSVSRSASATAPRRSARISASRSKSASASTSRRSTKSRRAR